MLIINVVGKCARAAPDSSRKDRMKFIVAIDGGEGGERTIEADNLESAEVLAKKWVKGGDYPMNIITSVVLTPEQVKEYTARIAEFERRDANE